MDAAATTEPSREHPRLPRAGDIVGGKYRIEDVPVLGSGGMGIVLSAVHVALHERVALKLLKPDAARRGDAARRFVREAQAAIRVRSEHVVRVHDVGTLETGVHYIVMEHLTGRDLARHLEETGPLPLNEAVTYVLQACEAVAEAHSLGIVHRDLKPSNLFLVHRADASPSIKVLDFGISKFMSGDDVRDQAEVTEQDSDVEPEPVGSVQREEHAPPEVVRASLTGTRAHLGSPRYMAPEQMLSARDVDVRADVWALGAILYELVVGRPAFSGQASSVAQGVREGRFTPVARLRPGVPRVLEEAIHRCLSVDRDKRYASVGELAVALISLATPEGVICARRAARLGAVTIDEGGRSRRIRGAVILGGIVVLCAGVVGVLAARGHEDRSSATPTLPSSPPETSSASSPPSLVASSIPPVSIPWNAPPTPSQPTASAAPPNRTPSPTYAPTPAASASAPAPRKVDPHLDPGHLFDDPH